MHSSLLRLTRQIGHKAAFLLARYRRSAQGKTAWRRARDASWQARGQPTLREAWQPTGQAALGARSVA
jgi:hypothetical protein